MHPHARAVEFSSELSQRVATDDALYALVKSAFDELTKIIGGAHDVRSSPLSEIPRPAEEWS